MSYIGIVRDDGKVEYNANFVLGSKGAAKLERGKWYTAKDLADLSGCANFIDTQVKGEDARRKWRLDEV